MILKELTLEELARERLARLRTLRGLLDFVDEARKAPVLDRRGTKVVTDELWDT